MKKEKTLITVLILVVLVVVGFLLINNKKAETPGVKETSADSVDTNNDEPDPVSVSIKDAAFTPASITVKVGTTVTWTNNDDMSHTVTADNLVGDAPSTPELVKGDTYSFTFKEVGTYKYHCKIHSSMTGTVVVTE
jgi:plastocyanin